MVFSTTLALCMRMAANLTAASQGSESFGAICAAFSDACGFQSKSLVSDIFEISRGQPLTFQLGTGRVIKGWDQGLVRI